MQIFPKLFEMLPDAEELLSLEPEELAGYLLISLESSDSITLDEVISNTDMSAARHRNSNLKNLSGHGDQVLLALMEAWQWLEREGFVAPKPPDLANDKNFTEKTRYFVTRRGKRVETLESLKTYRKTNLLPKHQLHPIIAQKVWSIFLQGDYDTAVFQAFKQVEVAVRKAGGYNEKDIGVKLMSKAFNETTGNLTDQNQHPDEKNARLLLFRGAIGSYKNPSSHRDVELIAEEAAEIIIFASHLLRIVDSCNPPETP